MSIQLHEKKAFLKNMKRKQVSVKSIDTISDSFV